MKKMLPICSLFFLLIFLIPSLSVKAAAYEPDFEPVSQGVILVNLDTEAVVYEKNADLRLEPASTTKIMTYIIAAEHISDLEGTMITAKKEVLDRLDGTGSSTMGLQDDETLSAMDLLHGLMIRSGNDASLVLADYVCNGDINQFVEMMNQKAQELGCQDTHFTNPHGLHDENHYTTARDLYLITKYAMTLPNFMEISSKVSYVLPATNKQETAASPPPTTSLTRMPRAIITICMPRASRPAPMTRPDTAWFPPRSATATATCAWRWGRPRWTKTGTPSPTTAKCATARACTSGHFRIWR